MTYSWSFSDVTKLELLEFKLEKIIGIYKHAGKVRKSPLNACQFYKIYSVFFCSIQWPKNKYFQSFYIQHYYSPLGQFTPVSGLYSKARLNIIYSYTEKFAKNTTDSNLRICEYINYIKTGF